MKICLSNTRYEVREDAEPDNVKTTHRNQLIEFFPKGKRVPPLNIINFAVISRDSNFFEQLVNSQFKQKKH